jgi:hypothetical protein
MMANAVIVDCQREKSGFGKIANDARTCPPLQGMHNRGKPFVELVHSILKSLAELFNSTG